MKMQLLMEVLLPLAYSVAAIHMLFVLMLSGIGFTQKNTPKAFAKLPNDLYSLLRRVLSLFTCESTESPNKLGWKGSLR